MEKLNEQFEILQNELNNVNEQVSGSGIGSWIIYGIVTTTIAVTIFIITNNFLEKNFEINLFNICGKGLKYSSEKLWDVSSFTGKQLKRIWNRGGQETIQKLTQIGIIKDGGNSEELNNIQNDSVKIEQIDDSASGEEFFNNGRQQSELENFNEQEELFGKNSYGWINYAKYKRELIESIRLKNEKK